MKPLFTSVVLKRQSIVLIFFTLFSLASCGKSVDTEELASFPQFEEVLKKFEEEGYGLQSPLYVDFAKKPDGYYVLSFDVETPDDKEEHLFWSLKSKEYEDLGDEFKNYSQNTFNAASFRAKAYNFNRMVYYNYPDADEDAIELLEGADNLTDSLYEALGRAYSLHCDELSGLKKMDADFDGMNEDEANEYIKYANKSLQTYEELVKINPSYEVLVGGVKTKLAHDYVHYWYELDVAGFPDDARSFLEQAKYDDLMLNFAKNILKSCGKNAILFTYGDSDTFPLWFVQEILGFRTDVTVINTSLANVPYYNEYHLKKSDIKTSLGKEDYANHQLDYIMLYSDGINYEKSIDLNRFLEMLKKKNMSTYQDRNYPDYPAFPYLNFYLETTLPTRDSLGLDDRLELSTMGTYLFLSDIFQLDIIAQNINKRPIHFALTGSGTAKLFSEKENRLMTYQLVPSVQGMYKGYTSQGYVDLDESKRMLMDEFEFGNPERTPYQSPNMAQNYVFQFCNVAMGYVQEQRPDDARDILNKSEKEFPLESFESSTNIVLYVANCWMELGEKKDVQRCVNIALDDLESNKADFEDIELERYLNSIEGMCMEMALEGMARVRNLRK
ncbi:MAG: hypothetical protein MI810_03315 [Flavobacteriales bacterium]|nr:hypothetical protein [Flavobacteriales bacterium]